jgi:hypothetical protein
VPTGSVAEAGVTASRVNVGGFTFSVAVPTIPELTCVAVIVVVPGETADARPAAEMVATFAALDDHTTASIPLEPSTTFERSSKMPVAT